MAIIVYFFVFFYCFFFQKIEDTEEPHHEDADLEPPEVADDTVWLCQPRGEETRENKRPTLKAKQASAAMKKPETMMTKGDFKTKVGVMKKPESKMKAMNLVKYGPMKINAKAKETTKKT